MEERTKTVNTVKALEAGAGDESSLLPAFRYCAPDVSNEGMYQVKYIRADS